MDKYKAVIYLNALEVILSLGIILLACIYNWWLLIILIFVGSANTEKRIMGIKT